MVERAHSRLLSDAAITTALTLSNIIVGVFFQSYLAARLGDSKAADVYSAGVAFPTVMATAIIGSVPLVLVPFIARRRADSKAGFSARTARFILAVAVVASIGLYVLAPLLSHVVAPGFSGPKLAATAHFLQVTSAVPLLAALAAVGQSLAYLDRHFIRGGAGAAINGLGLLAATIVLGEHRLSSGVLAIAVVAGYFLQAAWLAPEIVAFRRSLTSVEPDPSDRLFVRSLLTLTAGSIVFKGQPAIERIIATSLGPGSAAIMAYALKVATGLVAFSGGLQTVTMPAFSHSISRNDHDATCRSLATVLSLALAIAGVLCSVTILTIRQITAILYGRGHLTLHAEHEIAVVTLGYLLFVFASSMSGPVANVHYARNRQRWAALVSLAGVFVGLGACFGLSRVLGLVGVSIGTGLGLLVPVLAYAGALTGQLPGWSWRAWLRHNFSLILTLVGGFSLALLTTHFLRLPDPARGRLVITVAVLSLKLVLLLTSLGVAAVIMRLNPRHAFASPAAVGDTVQ